LPRRACIRAWLRAGRGECVARPLGTVAASAPCDPGPVVLPGPYGLRRPRRPRPRCMPPALSSDLQPVVLEVFVLRPWTSWEQAVRMSADALPRCTPVLLRGRRPDSTSDVQSLADYWRSVVCPLRPYGLLVGRLLAVCGLSPPTKRRATCSPVSWRSSSGDRGHLAHRLPACQRTRCPRFISTRTAPRFDQRLVVRCAGGLRFKTMVITAANGRPRGYHRTGNGDW
jgi:hypothetical protein